MKIALISPKGPLYRVRGGIFKKSLRYQPLTLTTLAALVPSELNAQITVYDEGVQPIPETIDANLVGLTVITGTARRAYELATRFRAEGKTVVLGGPHVTLIPQEAALYGDAICVGYAEDSWPALLRDFSRDALKPAYHQSQDFSLDRPDIPYARRDLFDSGQFLTQAVFEATRSCVHDCEFCVAPAAWGRQQYQKPVDWVINDIRQFGQKKLIFVDLNLISDRNYARELFTKLVPLNVEWFGLSTVLLAHDPELMELVARSGCKGLLLGLETVTPESLRDAKKRFNGSVDFKQFIGDLHHLGISIQGCFVFGLDHDTPAVFDATVEFALDAGVDLPRFAVLTPFPGTPLHTRLESEGRILTQEWELYDGQHVVFQPRAMSVQELAEGHERAWKKVYRWTSIAKRLWVARNFQTLALTANFGYRFYAHNLHRYYTCDWPIQALPPRVSGITAIPVASSNKAICG